MSSRILFLEDDALFAETIIDLLQEELYEVKHFMNGQDALNATFSSKFDIYLLDINVPLIDGVSLLHELREANDNTPAIFLTSHKDKSMMKKSFLSGGDDYITKPFDLDELIWRMQALIKRTQKNEVTELGALKHDITHKSIYYKAKELELSKKEYDLLVLLMNHVNSCVPKEMIYETLWSVSEGGSDGAIRVYINRLKQLLVGIHIQNIRSVGYKLVY